MHLHGTYATGAEMNLETYTRAQMARFAIEEAARYGGVNNMLAILHVLRNRVFAGWGDWTEVVLRAPDKRGNAYTNGQMNVRTTNVRQLLGRVDDIYSRTDTVDLTGGALFYVDPDQPVLEWFRREILDQPEEHRRVAHIGPVWFFK